MVMITWEPTHRELPRTRNMSNYTVYTSKFPLTSVQLALANLTNQVRNFFEYSHHVDQKRTAVGYESPELGINGRTSPVNMSITVHCGGGLAAFLVTRPWLIGLLDMNFRSMDSVSRQFSLYLPFL